MFTRSSHPRASADAEGGALPIVHIHGAVISGRYMVPTAERLAGAHSVYIPDLPGFGRSDAPRRPLTVSELARALHLWMVTAGIPRAHLLGNSLGAQVATELADRWPADVASLILVGPTVDHAARSRTAQLWRLAKDAFLERPSLIPLHLLDILRAGWRFAGSTLDIALADRIEEKLPRLEIPILIVCGSFDPLAPVEWCRWLAAQSPHARMQVLDGPHALNYSRPDELAQCVDEWVATLGRGYPPARRPRLVAR